MMFLFRRRSIRRVSSAYLKPLKYMILFLRFGSALEPFLTFRAYIYALDDLLAERPLHPPKVYHLCIESHCVYEICFAGNVFTS